ncbi:hypothetical protein AGMMS49546_00080 [Spirochaetia bacterium]|nr:hypothetical protein AGMMS49546_00080 [Spirochaetia bacterium]
MKHGFIFRLIIVLVFAALAGSLYAAEAGDISFSIRYFDKRVYHVPGAGGEPIYVQVTIANNSPATYRFKLADDRAFSIDFDIRTLTNRAVEPSGRLVQKRTTSGQVFFREIAVESGESFSFVEDLRDYAEFKEPGSFIVRARMYPELLRPEGTRYRELTAAAGNALPGAAGPLESNRLNLSLRTPAIPGPTGTPLALDADTRTVLTWERLAPDEVVEYFLTARQKSQWEKYFLYLDIEAVIARDPVRKKQWVAEGEEGRRRMIERYRTELQSAIIDGDISMIPSEFTVERTVYNALEATVIVEEKFKTGNYTERKRYTYSLRRKDDVWTIVDYVVMNLGTE